MDACFAVTGRDCSQPYIAWTKSEDCVEGAMADAEKCRKICSYVRGSSPSRKLWEMRTSLFMPVGIAVLLMVFGRAYVILGTVCRTCNKTRHDMGLTTRP